jgi:hypothetical protein
MTVDDQAPDDLVPKLAEFTRQYHTEFDRRLEAAGRDVFPFHGEPTPVVAIIKGSDGYVVFYLPAPPDEEKIPAGYYGYDLSEHSLNRICQSVSVHRLQVASAELGKPWNSFPPITEDAPPIPDFHGPWIHDDVRRAAAEGSLSSLPGMTVSPIVNVEQGIRVGISPARVRVWSPMFDFPSLGPRRLFLWPYADFWWSPEQLDLSTQAAIEAAEKDLVAFQTILAAVDQLTPEFVQNDTGASAADILDRLCAELLDLVEHFGGDEERIHQWLYRRQHWVFLDPGARDVRSKIPFGARVSDFVVERTDSTYLLIELEPPAVPIFRSDNHEPTAPFNHACQQVRDWRRYIRDNVHTVRSELGFPEIYEPEGAVVIGRSSMITDGEARLRWRDLKTRDIGVTTYDEMIERVRALAASLRHVIRRSRP